MFVCADYFHCTVCVFIIFSFNSLEFDIIANNFCVYYIFPLIFHIPNNFSVFNVSPIENTKFDVTVLDLNRF